MYEELLATFPSSPYLQCQLAHAKYNLREFDEAQLNFETLLKRDPFRLDQVRACASLPGRECDTLTDDLSSAHGLTHHLQDCAAHIRWSLAGRYILEHSLREGVQACSFVPGSRMRVHRQVSA